jgi:hypothetical protein
MFDFYFLHLSSSFHIPDLLDSGRLRPGPWRALPAKAIAPLWQRAPFPCRAWVQIPVLMIGLYKTPPKKNAKSTIPTENEKMGVTMMINVILYL